MWYLAFLTWCFDSFMEKKVYPKKDILFTDEFILDFLR